jgi:carbon storage regulator
LLSLARRKNESIIIGDDIIVTVLDFENGKVKFSVKAPSHIKIHRKERHGLPALESNG